MSSFHQKIEKNLMLLSLLIILTVSIGGLAEIVPLLFIKEMMTPVKNLQPFTALELEGRDIYIREGCNNCHSQMIRPFRAEVERYGHYSVAGESVWNRPHLWGSKRTGPDLARVGGRYSDDWHIAHMYDPRSVVPESNMPAFKWLFETPVDNSYTQRKLEILRDFGVPYSDEDISNAAKSVEGHREIDALVAYLQSLGKALR